MQTGPRNLITDVAGLRVGNAGDARLRSGVTVLTADAPFTAGVHVMGGAPGTRETDLLAPDRAVQQVDALVLSGGSAFGLDAASGVAEGLREAGRGFAVGAARVPIVPAAILFDLLNGGAQDWTENPYKALGRTALANASEDFAIGTEGAGTGATTATLKGGLGSASTLPARWHHGGRAGRGQCAGRGHGGRRPAFLGRAVRDRRRVRRAWPRAACPRPDERAHQAARRTAIPPSASSPPTPRSVRRNARGLPPLRMTGSPARSCRRTR